MSTFHGWPEAAVDPTPLYGPTGQVLSEVVVPPFPIGPTTTVCPCGGIPSGNNRDGAQ